MSTIKVTTLQNLSGVEVYTAKSWVSFDGTGTVAINGSGNVSSITDLGTGHYTVNFASSLPSVNYANLGTTGNNGSALYTQFRGPTLRLSASTTFYDKNLSGSAVDAEELNVLAIL